jgi:hypothetical protein
MRRHILHITAFKRVAKIQGFSFARYENTGKVQELIFVPVLSNIRKVFIKHGMRNVVYEMLVTALSDVK